MKEASSKRKFYYNKKLYVDNLLVLVYNSFVLKTNSQYVALWGVIQLGAQGTQKRTPQKT